MVSDTPHTTVLTVLQDGAAALYFVPENASSLITVSKSSLIHFESWECNYLIIESKEADVSRRLPESSDVFGRNILLIANQPMPAFSYLYNERDVYKASISQL